MPVDFSKFRWIHPPAHFEITSNTLTLTTDPFTDFWQRTYYNFSHDNAHACLFAVQETEFSFSVRTRWNPAKLFDQCGVVVYQNPENWFKASAEYDNEQFSRLGSVVTNLGYSDWATTDIDGNLHEMSYRLSRRGQDFLIENSLDGMHFVQMRIFHLHLPIDAVNLGVYACSPLNSSMPVEFSDFVLGECQWALYESPD